MNAQRDYQLPEQPHCVLMDGPQETDMDGGVEWTVCFGTDEGDVIEARNAIWRCDSYNSAIEFGHSLAKRYNLEPINEADDY